MRGMQRPISWGVLGMLALAAAIVPTPGRARPPDIVLIVAEDLSPRIGAFGDPVARTPNLDRLAAEGVRYPNVFTTAGVCAPSRAALITGLHQIAIGAQHMRASTRPAGGYAAVPPPDVKAFPERLRAAGYFTRVGYKLDYQFSGPMNGSGPFTIWDEEGAEEGWAERPDDAPLFAMFNPAHTHESGVFRPLGSWPHGTIHFTMQLARAFLLDAAPGPRTDPATVVLPPYIPDTPVQRADLARHYDNIRAMDARVGEILADIDHAGMHDRTIVVWTTDHGDGLPRAKRELFDTGLRVPMIVRWPASLRPDGVAPGTVDEQLVSFVDLAPTILEWAGAPLPDGLHGRSLSSLRRAPRRYVHAARDRIDEVPDRQRAVRDDRYKYVRSWVPDQPGGHALAFRDNQDGMRELWRLREADELDPVQSRWFEPPGEERLYDLSVDPWELEDVAGDPAHAVALVRLRAELDRWLAAVGDTSSEPEDAMAERFWPGGEQPATAGPAFGWDGARVAITSASEGASIGYRVDGGRWRLYTGPVALAAGVELEAKAVRYGWRESAVASFRRP